MTRPCLFLVEKKRDQDSGLSLGLAWSLAKDVAPRQVGENWVKAEKVPGGHRSASLSTQSRAVCHRKCSLWDNLERTTGDVR